MRKNLAATTAMERVTDLDERLSNLVIKVGPTLIFYFCCLYILIALTFTINGGACI